MRGSVLAVLVSLPLHPLLDGLRFPQSPGRIFLLLLLALHVPAKLGCRETLPFSDVSDHRDRAEMEYNGFHHPSHCPTRQKARCRFGPEHLGRNGLEAEIRHNTGDGYANA